MLVAIMAEKEQIDATGVAEDAAMENVAEPVLYEIGYHVIPLVPEEELSKEVVAVREVFEKHGGVFKTEEFPQRMSLAYPMSKTVENNRQTYDQSYFGWMLFEVDPAVAQTVQAEIRALPTILRFILIKRDSVESAITRKPQQESEPEEVTAAVSAEKEEKAAPALSEEELDKTIDDLVKE